MIASREFMDSLFMIRRVGQASWPVVVFANASGAFGYRNDRPPGLSYPALRDVSAARVHVDRIERLAAGHEQAVALGAAETYVGADLGQQDHADALAARREDVNP